MPADLCRTHGLQSCTLARNMYHASLRASRCHTAGFVIKLFITVFHQIRLTNQSMGANFTAPSWSTAEKVPLYMGYTIHTMRQTIHVHRIHRTRFDFPNRP